MKRSKSISVIVIVVAFGIGTTVISTLLMQSRFISGGRQSDYLDLTALNGSTYPRVSSASTKPLEKSIPTILELVGNTDNYECPEGLVLVKDSIDPSFYEKSERKIPKVVHMTSKSRCMTEAFASNVDKWRFKGHSFFLHDDDAVDRLIETHWPEFPQLQKTLECMVPGAAIADLWRYLMLWEFGGIYTDIDNAPGVLFWNETGSVITNETDALFEQEKGGFPSQYFFASSPHHPIMFLAVYNTMHRVTDLQSVRKQYVPFVTGPGAIKSAFVRMSLALFVYALFGYTFLNFLP